MTETLPPPTRAPVPTAAPRMQVQRRIRRPHLHLPRALWLCMAITLANALAWAFLTPAFQGPDEPVHVGYAQYVAETGKLPRSLSPYYAPSSDANAALNGIPFTILGHPDWSLADGRRLQKKLDQPLGRVAEQGAGYIATNPPLYYLLAAVPYHVAGNGNFLDRMYAMRILSALLAALTTGFVFLFMRELLPGTPWLWTLGALAVAFQPVFGFIGGVVNNDNLLWTASAALFYLLARGFRRGLTPGVGAGIGAAVAAGILTKGSMFGLVPGALLAVGLMAWRAPAGDRRRALQGLAAALALAAIPMGAWLIVNHAVAHRSNVSTTTAGFTSIPHTSLSGQLSYLWQFYLPRMPWMNHWFVGLPVWDTYFQGFVGRFGWFQYGFPLWVYWFALALAVGVVGLAGVGLYRSGAIRRRFPELLSYVVLAAGIGLVVNVVGYRYHVDTGINFEQTRYLFPILPLYAALVAVAARGAGRRFGPIFAAVFLTLAIADSVFAQLLTIARYYG